MLQVPNKNNRNEDVRRNVIIIYNLIVTYIIFLYAMNNYLILRNQ